MTPAAAFLAAPRFYGEWPTWLWVFVGAVTLATVAVALVLNRR